MDNETESQCADARPYDAQHHIEDLERRFHQFMHAIDRGYEVEADLRDRLHERIAALEASAKKLDLQVGELFARCSRCGFSNRGEGCACVQTAKDHSKRIERMENKSATLVPRQLVDRIEELEAAVVKLAGCADATTRFDELDRQARWHATANAALMGLLAGNGEETLGMDCIREQAAGEADFRHGPLEGKP